MNRKGFYHIYAVVIITGLALFLLIIQIAFVAAPLSKSDEVIFCTMEAKLCSDGTAVGRIGPRCEFASCPNNETAT